MMLEHCVWDMLLVQQMSRRFGPNPETHLRVVMEGREEIYLADAGRAVTWSSSATTQKTWHGDKRKKKKQHPSRRTCVQPLSSLPSPPSLPSSSPRLLCRAVSYTHLTIERWKMINSRSPPHTHITNPHSSALSLTQSRGEDAAVAVMEIIAYLQQLLRPVWTIISIEYPLLIAWSAQTFR